MTFFVRIPLYIKNSFILITLLLATVNVNSQERAASLIHQQSFGSDPYNKIAYNDRIVLASGKKEAGSPKLSGLVDILKYTDTGFELINQVKFSDSKSELPFEEIHDVAYFNDYWLILAYGHYGYHIISATTSDGKIEKIDELQLNYYDMTELVLGGSNNFYIVSREAALSATHISLSSSGKFIANNKIEFGKKPNEPNYLDHFSVSYENRVLYLTSNQAESTAGIYKLPLADDGSFQEPVEILLNGAMSNYHTIKVHGDLWLMSYHYWGFQVAQLEGNALKIIYQSPENTSYEDFEVKDNYIYAASLFGTIDIYEIEESDVITFTRSQSTSGFINDSLLVDDKLFLTKDAEGIEVFQIHQHSSLTSIATFNQSGQITDIDKQGNELASAAMDQSLYFWTINENSDASLDAFYKARSIQGVVWDEDKVVISDSGRLETHRIDNIKRNIDLGISHGIVSSSGRDGQLVKVDNGFIVSAFNKITFADSEKNILSSIEYDQYPYDQQLVVSGDLLFVTHQVPSEVIIYDISDLTDITELNRIQRNHYIIGNVAAKNHYLFVPVISNNNELVITPYDISQPEKLVELTSIKVDVYNPDIFNNEIALHIYEEFLVVVGDYGVLFDITDPTKPIKIHKNTAISSDGFGKGFGKELFTVAKYTSGNLQHSKINLAPTHSNITISLNEDEQGTANLDASDQEGDSVVFEIISVPTKGNLTLTDNKTISYQPEPNLNGYDSAKILVTDIHGGASEFNVEIQINAINDTPNIETTLIEVSEDQSLTLSLEALDVDGDELMFSLIKQANNGSATLTDKGVLTYLSNPNFNGEDVIEVQVTDSEGASDTKIIPINVAQVNDLPVYIGNSEFNGVEDQTLTFMLSGSDIDGDSIEYDFSFLPAGWDGSIDGENVTINPKENDHGDFSIRILLNDGTTVVEQLLNIILDAVNDEPTLTEDTVSISVISGKAISTTLIASDIDGDSLSFSITEQPTKGVANVNESGVVTFTANTGTQGADSFIVTVSDSSGASASQIINVSISPVPDKTSDNKKSGGSFSWMCLLITGLLVVNRKLLGYKISLSRTG